jgi:aminopeptidase N
MRIPTRTILAALLVLSACSRVGGSAEEFHPEGPPDVVVTPEAVADLMISSRDADRHAAFLASDDRRGRATRGPGLERTAAWIGEQFQRAGLEAGGDAGGYIQFWPYERADGDTVEVSNVVGWLSGGDLTRADEYVLLVAHYDHLGVGAPDEDGDSIYNGADDNASGMAVLVEVAQAFGALPEAPSRPVVFLAASGHEEGLRGSRWFAAHPTIRLDSAIAVLNLDTVGRNHPDSIGVVGAPYSGLGPLIDSVAAGLSEPHELAIAHDFDPALFRESDQWPFARLGIPAVQLYSGPHPDLRTPRDENGELDHDKIARVARLVFLTAYRLSTEEVVPEWTAEGRAVLGR